MQVESHVELAKKAEFKGRDQVEGVVVEYEEFPGNWRCRREQVALGFGVEKLFEFVGLSGQHRL